MWCFAEGFHGWSMFGGIGMILFWILIAALTVWVVTLVMRHNKHDSSSHALDIAKERYAKGEITQEEYEQIKKSL